MADYKTSFRELKVWQRAIELAAVCDAMGTRVARLRPHLGRQLASAGASIPANIAEGSGRRTRGDLLRHLSIACGSLREVESHLLLVERLAAAPSSTIQEALALADEVGRMLVGLDRKLRESPNAGPRATRS
jgi:four helix bundle protein